MRRRGLTSDRNTSAGAPRSAVETSHWPTLSKHWNQVGPPLRPSNEDLAFLAHHRPTVPAGRRARALILGVTPEIYQTLREDWDVLAVDNNPGMIESVWPGSATEIVQADWRELALPPSSRDVAFMDGGLHLLRYPDDQQLFVSRLHDVLAPDSKFILRLFVPPLRRETPDQVIAELFD